MRSWKVALALACLLARPLAADDWPQLQRDSFRSGASAETGVTEPLTEAWHVDLPAGVSVVSSPVVSDGYVLLGAIDGLLRCFDETSGTLLWTWQGKEPIAATPLVSNGLVYAIDRAGTLACLDLATGSVVWTRALGGQGLSSPTVFGNQLFFGTGFPAKTVSSANTTTGASIWNKQLTQPSFASPATDGASVWSITNDGKLFRANALDGTGVWQDSTMGSPQGTAILINGGTLYYAPGGYDTALYRIDAASGLPAWVTPLLSAGDPATQNASTCPEAGVFSTKVVPNWRYIASGALHLSGGSVCVEGGTTELRLYSVNEGTGLINWALDAGAPDPNLPFASSPVSGSGRVFVGGGAGGELLVVNPSGGGSVAQNIPMPGVVASSPAVANARVYAASSGGRLTAFDGAGNHAPGVIPGGVTPADGGIGTGPTVTVTWSAASDSGPNADPSSALRYLVRWSNSGEVLKHFDGQALTAAGVTSQALTSYPDGTVVTWRVRTLDTQGAYSPWSAPHSFTLYYPWRVQGRVTLGGMGLAGVQVTMTGSGSGTAITDANGYYNFYSVPNGTYHLAFSLAGYAFSPYSLDLTVAGAHVLGLNSSATTATYSIAGTVTWGAIGLQGVQVTLSGGSAASATTDANGHYVFSSLGAGSYTITPGGYHLSFSPTSRSLSLASNATGQDFNATRTGTGGEVVVGLGSGGQGQLVVRGGPSAGYPVVDWFGLPWTPYDTANGAGHPAMADLDGDGLDEVIVGLGSYPSNGGWIAVFDDAMHGNRLLSWIHVPWAAYNAANGETWPACGNIDASGTKKVVVGFGPQSGGYLLILDGMSNGFAPLRWIRVGTSDYQNANGATYPCVGDVSGSGVDDILVGLGDGGQGQVWLIDSSPGYDIEYPIQVPWAAYASAGGSTRPACGDLDGDGRADVVVGLGGPSANGWWCCLDDQRAGFALRQWRQLPWSPYDSAVGTTRPAVGDILGNGKKQVVIGLGTYPSNGGWLCTFGDLSSGLAPIGWWNLGWAGYDARNGETLPAIGVTR